MFQASHHMAASTAASDVVLLAAAVLLILSDPSVPFESVVHASLNDHVRLWV